MWLLWILRELKTLVTSISEDAKAHPFKILVELPVFARCIVANDRSDFSAVLQFRLCITKLRTRVASNRPRFDSRRARIACELSETALYTRLSVRGLRSFMRARGARTNGRFVNANFTPHGRWLTRFRWFLFCHGYALPFRGAIVRASLRESTRGRFELVLTGRAGCAKQGEDPGWMTVNDCKTEEER